MSDSANPSLQVTTPPLEMPPLPPQHLGLRKLVKLTLGVAALVLPILVVGLLTAWNAAAVAACVALVAIAYHFRWSLYSLALQVSGRGTECSAGLALRIPRDDVRAQAIRKRVEGSARLLEKDENLELWETEAGRFWIPARGTAAVLFEMLAERSLDCYGGNTQGVRSGDVVLDCGANVGVFVREALDAGARLVIASEPSPENLACLQRNFRNEVAGGRVIVCDRGLWHEDTVLSLGISESPAGDSFIQDNHPRTPGPKLRVTTIDNLVSELKLERLDFIKMDIEGAERNALNGAAKTLSAFRPRLAISAYHLSDDPIVLTRIVNEFRPNSQRTATQGRMLYGGLLHSRIAPLVLFFK